MKNLKISQKLFVSFFIVIAVFVSITAYQLIKLNTLLKLQDEGGNRTDALVFAKETESMAIELYQVVADAIINRNLTESERVWNEVKNSTLSDLNELETKIDTDTEKEYVKEIRAQLQTFFMLFENELMPLLKGDSSVDEIRIIDEKFDFLIEEIHKPIINLTTFIEAENHKADMLFDSTGVKVFSLSIVFCLLAIAIAIVFTIIMVNLIAKPLAKGVEFAKEIAGGNLLATLNVNQKDEVGILAHSLQDMVAKLKDVIGNINTGADNIASASMQMSSTSQQMSQGVSEQAASTEEVSSSMEEMSANILQNTDNAMQTEKISNIALDGINKVSSASQQSLMSIKEIAQKITIINDIAFQTNILALNAAVEAARAGEQGKGFAVVAAEVRKLAERSKIAADEIGVISKNSVNVTEESVKLLNNLMPEIQKTAKLVQEITAASQEQNNGASEINNAIQQLNTVTQQNAASSEELASSAEELASQAEILKDTVSFFKVDLGYKNHNVKKVEAMHAGKRATMIDYSRKPAAVKEQIVAKAKVNTKNQGGVHFNMKDTDDSAFENF